MNAFISNPSKQEKITGTALALLAFLLFSTSDLCAKLLGGTLPPYEVSFFGGVFGLLLVPFLWTKETNFRSLFPSGKRLRALWALRAVSIFGTTACSVTAFMLLPMTQTVALTFLLPLVTNCLTVLFLRQNVPLSSWVMALVGFIGILITLHLNPYDLKFGLGEICAVGVALTMGINVLTAKALTGKISDLSIYLAALAGPLIGDSLIFGQSFIWPHSLKICALLFGYGILIAIGQLFLIYASKKIAASSVTLAQYGQIIWATFFGIMIFKDFPALHTYIGLGILLFSGFLGVLLQRRENASSF